jgi:mevalonate kinase
MSPPEMSEMIPTAVIASAPATLMLMGEHAVLHGSPCLVTAIDSRLSVQIERDPGLPTGHLSIHSDLGSFEGDLSGLCALSDFRFLASTLTEFEPLYRSHPNGLTIRIRSSFSSTVGFGSSAAVLVASLAALSRLLMPTPFSPQRLFERSLAHLHRVQGRGSGADLAAAVFGGVLGYRCLPRPEWCRIPHPPTGLTAVYAGYKTPTAEVIAWVQHRAAQDPERYDALYHAIQEAVGRAIVAAERSDWARFLSEIDENQRLMDALGVCDDTLAMIHGRLQEAFPGAHPKISGSGLGDCMIAFSALPSDLFPHHPAIQTLPIQWGLEGVLYHDPFS